ncbi:MAG: hypothetical protein FWE91_02190 [Defluviitaleaceae bacterium]|nr:hypothetical protein [Defluviitaleaceae bacterium]
MYTYHDYQGTGYNYQISYVYLDFGGNIIVQESINDGFIEGGEFDGFPIVKPDLPDVRVSLSIQPRKWTYRLGLMDRTTGENIISSAYVDKYGVPEELAPDDPESERHNEWLALYERAYGQIVELFREIHEFFGEDILK